VHFKPGNNHEILTNGRDSTLKVVDARTSTVIKTFCDPGFRTLTNQASSSFSPDGAYAAAGSGDSGDIFVWNVSSGDLEKRLSSHQCGAVGLAWGKGGNNGQQVASIDKSGVLILWA
jgi:autophagy-related protein 16